MNTDVGLRTIVKDKIASSFLRKALPDSRRIKVEARGGWVVLRGSDVRVPGWSVQKRSGRPLLHKACSMLRTTSSLALRPLKK